MPALLETTLPLPLARRGKVRDVYDLGDSFLFVATDRISAFDVVLSPGIPDKGKILTQISTFWFRHFGDIENHLLETDLDAFPAEVRAHPELRGRSVIVKKCHVVPVECVARGYLVGSGLKEYNETGTRLRHRAGERPDHRQQTARADLHAGDERRDRPRREHLVRADVHDRRRRSRRAAARPDAAHLQARRRIRAQRAASSSPTRSSSSASTNIRRGNIVVWIDEALTPDSSRFWPADRYAVGKNPPSFDKQFVRDWLETTGWDKASTPPELPEDVVMKTREKYIDAFRTLTGAEPEL